MQGAEERHSHIAIVGTGFAGIGLAVKLQRAGITDFVIFERAEDVGGTWRDNTYPGCQCDVPSHLYSFSFKLNPNWTRTYSMQAEIWAYLRATAEEMNVLPFVRFGHTVTGAKWNDDGARWEIETNHGTFTADIAISAHGGLAEPAFPQIDGLEEFEGDLFHSAAWNHDIDLTGKTVGVVDTGASAVQIVPRIQPKVARMHVFQRTPAWVLPHTDRRTTTFERRLYRRVPAAQRLVRNAIYWAREILVFGLTKNIKLLRPLRSLAVKHMERQISDPELRRKLLPTYSPGCKRLVLSNHFYPAVAAPNTELVTDRIERVGPRSVITADGREREIDALVLATGFRVADNPVMGMARGRDGRSLRDVWSGTGTRAYLGTVVDGFPNFFLMSGPNTGIGHNSLLVMIEAQIDYTVDTIRYMRDHGVGTVEVKGDVLEAYNRKLQKKMSRTVWTTGGCSSWYLDDEGRNPTLWPDFTWRFRHLTRSFNPKDFDLRPPARTRRDRELVDA